jgi:hypothetical protein
LIIPYGGELQLRNRYWAQSDGLDVPKLKMIAFSDPLLCGVAGALYGHEVAILSESSSMGIRASGDDGSGGIGSIQVHISGLIDDLPGYLRFLGTIRGHLWRCLVALLFFAQKVVD